MNQETRGWIDGMLGVVIFAGSLPATRVAVHDMSPLFLTCMRASVAALLAALALRYMQQRLPAAAHWPGLLVVAAGAVLGFPLLTALALQHITSAHSLVFIGLLPLCTALFGVLRGGERPRLAFWLFSGLGSLCVVGYAARGSLDASLYGDALMLVAILVCGLGYAEGARLSRSLGGWQVISWALLLALPLMLAGACWSWPAAPQDISLPAWLGLAYVSLFSMWLGFVFWYRGLALGGIATVGQLQLLQPFIGLGMAALLLQEAVNTTMLLTALGTVLCVAAAKRWAR